MLPPCHCTGLSHALDCLQVAATQPHAMVTAEGDVFYPDNEDDAAEFAEDFGAYPLDFEAFPFSTLRVSVDVGLPRGWTRVVRRARRHAVD